MNHRDIANPKAGGAERTIYEIGKRLVLRGHEVDVLAGGWHGALRHETIDGVRFHRYGNALLPHVVYPAFLKFHSDSDVIVDDMAHAAPWFSPWFTRLPGVVFFRHLHSRTLRGQVSPQLALFLSFLERHYSSIYSKWPFVTESEASERDLISIGIDGDRITRIPPGVDTGLFRPQTKSQEPTLVYFGGMREYKRPEHALLALKVLLDKGINCNLTMVGEGPVLPQLLHLRSFLELERHVVFTGKISDTQLVDIVSSSWVNIHCSEAEGWGLSIIESSASGTPTVAYKVPGVSETVKHQVNGLLVEDGNLRGLVAGIEEMFQNVETISKSSRNYAYRYSWSNTTLMWESRLKMVCNE